MEAVLAEADPWHGRVRPATVFFGGGTPTALNCGQLEKLLAGLHERFDFTALREWTIEMNPATVSMEKARLLLSMGVNRASMGVQAWDAELLRVLGRVHTTTQAEASYAILREAGFANVNLDLIFGIPGQTHAQWRESLAFTARLRPDHVSAYCLTYEEDTAFFDALTRGEFRQEEESDALFFETAMEELERHGYQQYEISNYAPPGRECAHNLAYWRGAEFLGLGPSAFSTVAGRRWKNIADTNRYIGGLREGEGIVGFSEDLAPETQRAERVAFGLRMREGIAAGFVKTRSTALRQLETSGLVVNQNGCVRLTRRGLLVADAVAGELL